MPNPSKSIAVITGDGKKHLTKAEKEQRTKAEQALSTGVALKERPEVAGDKVAHAEFVRMNALLAKIDKNDALYERIINAYCTLQAECRDFMRKREKFNDNLDALMDSDMDDEIKYRLQAQMQKTIIDVDKQIQAKRKMLFDIERENGLTIASALRSIPKKTNTPKNPLLEALADGKN